MCSIYNKERNKIKIFTRLTKLDIEKYDKCYLPYEGVFAFGGKF